MLFLSHLIAAAMAAAALTAGAHFVPEATEAHWDGKVATVTFREEQVDLPDGMTTISLRLTAEVDAICTAGESTLQIHRSATALQAQDYPVGEDGSVAGTGMVPLKVTTGLNVSDGWSCKATQVSLTAVLEDFYTGATLVHLADPKQRDDQVAV